MGWFFGCFGRKNKNSRSNNNGDQNLLLPQPLPASPSQPPIPIKALNPLKEQGFLRTRPLSTSAPPGRHDYGVLLLQENAGNALEQNKNKNSSKRKEDDPWSQVDDLAEELEDLRKQIEKGTTVHDSSNNQITEEVAFLKSCGALSQSPSELERKEAETLSISSYSRGWHSWLLPISSSPSPALPKPPRSQLSVGKGNVALRGLQVASSSSSTPAKQLACGIIHRRNEISKDNLQIGSFVTSGQVDESQPCSTNVSVMANSTPCKHQKVSSNLSGLTKQIREHESYISFTNESLSSKDTSTTMFKSNESPKISKLFQNQILSEALTPNTMDSNGKAEEAMNSSEQVHRLCDSIISKTEPSALVRSSVIGNHRYATVDSTVSASQVLSDSSSCSTTAENSCESPSGSISSSFNVASSGIKNECKATNNNVSCLQSDTICSHSVDGEEALSDLNCAHCLTKYGRVRCEDSVSGRPNELVTTPHQKNGSLNYATSMSPSHQRYAVDEEDIENSFLDGTSPQLSKQASIENVAMAHHEVMTTPVAWCKPQRVRNQPQSPVLTPVENEFQWKKLQQKGNQSIKSTDPITLTSLKNTNAMVLKTNLKSINPTSSTKRDILGFINNNNMVSETEAVVSVTASFSEWSRLAKEDEESHKKTQRDDILKKDSVAVDVSLSHWLNPTPSSSNQDGGLGCGIATPKNCLPRPPPLYNQPLPSPKFSRNERPTWIQPSPMLGQYERSVLGQQTPKVRQIEKPNLGPCSAYSQYNNSVTPKLQWDGQGIPNTTTKYNEDQKVKWFSSPFEVRLERELDKQQKAELQKKLFGRPT